MYAPIQTLLLWANALIIDFAVGAQGVSGCVRTGNWGSFL